MKQILTILLTLIFCTPLLIMAQAQDCREPIAAIAYEYEVKTVKSFESKWYHHFTRMFQIDSNLPFFNGQNTVVISANIAAQTAGGKAKMAYGILYDNGIPVGIFDPESDLPIALSYWVWQTNGYVSRVYTAKFYEKLDYGIRTFILKKDKKSGTPKKMMAVVSIYGFEGKLGEGSMTMSLHAYGAPSFSWQINWASPPTVLQPIAVR